MDELKDHVRLGTPGSGVIKHSLNGRGRLVAAMHVYDEMYRDDGFGSADKFHKLAMQSESEGWPTEPARFRHVFESEYLPSISFVDMGDMFIHDPVVQSVGNQSDVPTGQLAVLLACDSPVVLSRDSHLRRPGLAPKDLAVVYQAVAVMQSTELTYYVTAQVSGATVEAVNHGVKKVAKALDISQGAAWVGLAGAAAVAAYFLLRTPERRQLVGGMLGPAVRLYGQMTEQGEQARQRLFQLAVPMPQHPTPAQRIAKVLVEDRAPLSTETIMAVLRNRFAITPPSEQEIRAALHGSPCFVADERGRWQLGQVLGPPI